MEKYDFCNLVLNITVVIGEYEVNNYYFKGGKLRGGRYTFHNSVHGTGQES